MRLGKLGWLRRKPKPVGHTYTPPDPRWEQRTRVYTGEDDEVYMITVAMIYDQPVIFRITGPEQRVKRYNIARRDNSVDRIGQVEANHEWILIHYLLHYAKGHGRGLDGC